MPLLHNIEQIKKKFFRKMLDSKRNNLLFIFFSTLVVLALVSGCTMVSGDLGCAIQQRRDTKKAELGFPSPGVKWTMKTADDSENITTTTFTVLEDGNYDGLPVFQVSHRENIMVYDKGSRNWMATLRDGKVCCAAFPNGGTFSFPLWVGKTWASYFTYFDGEKEEKYDAVFQWRVETYELVNVPAGTLVTFRLKGDSSCMSRTLWYSPDLKIIVKWIIERYSCHHRGPAKVVHELLEYRVNGPLRIVKR